MKAWRKNSPGPHLGRKLKQTMVMGSGGIPQIVEDLLIRAGVMEKSNLNLTETQEPNTIEVAQ